MSKQEIWRKMGFAIQGDEEQLRVQLEAIQAELNAPTQFKVSQAWPDDKCNYIHILFKI